MECGRNLESGRSHQTWKREKREGQLKRAVGEKRERAVEPFELRPVILAVDRKIGRSELGRKCGAREY